VRIAVIVLAGGGSRRWGGRDKTAVLLGSRTVLEHAVRSLAAGAGVPLAAVVVAGPLDHPARPALPGVRWVREEPPGGGPVAGLAAAVEALPVDADAVVVGAGDAPFGGDAAPSLRAALTGGLDAVIGVDPSGRDQLLLGVHRIGALRAALASTGVAGARMRDVLVPMNLARVPVDARAALDLDTPEDLAVARRFLRSSGAGSAAAGFDPARPERRP
jgi:molybdenum cofactor guanylyltransferase